MNSLSGLLFLALVSGALSGHHVRHHVHSGRHHHHRYPSPPQHKYTTGPKGGLFREAGPVPASKVRQVCTKDEDQVDGFATLSALAWGTFNKVNGGNVKYWTSATCPSGRGYFIRVGGMRLPGNARVSSWARCASFQALEGKPANYVAASCDSWMKVLCKKLGSGGSYPSLPIPAPNPNQQQHHHQQPPQQQPPQSQPQVTYTKGPDGRLFRETNKCPRTNVDNACRTDEQQVDDFATLKAVTASIFKNTNGGEACYWTSARSPGHGAFTLRDGHKIAGLISQIWAKCAMFQAPRWGGLPGFRAVSCSGWYRVLCVKKVPGWKPPKTEPLQDLSQYKKASDGKYYREAKKVPAGDVSKACLPETEEIVDDYESFVTFARSGNSGQESFYWTTAYNAKGSGRYKFRSGRELADLWSTVWAKCAAFQVPRWGAPCYMIMNCKTHLAVLCKLKESQDSTTQQPDTTTPAPQETWRKRIYRRGSNGRKYRETLPVDWSRLREACDTNEIQVDDPAVLAYMARTLFKSWVQKNYWTSGRSETGRGQFTLKDGRKVLGVLPQIWAKCLAFRNNRFHTGLIGSHCSNNFRVACQAGPTDDNSSNDNVENPNSSEEDGRGSSSSGSGSSSSSESGSRSRERGSRSRERGSRSRERGSGSSTSQEDSIEEELNLPQPPTSCPEGTPAQGPDGTWYVFRVVNMKSTDHWWARGECIDNNATLPFIQSKEMLEALNREKKEKFCVLGAYTPVWAGITWHYKKETGETCTNVECNSATQLTWTAFDEETPAFAEFGTVFSSAFLKSDDVHVITKDGIKSIPRKINRRFVCQFRC